MAIHDAASQRLFVADDLRAGQDLLLSDDQAHYLVHVLRLKPSAAVLVFNGRDGEWRATLAEVKKRSATLVVDCQVRPQVAGPDIAYLFAPLKRSRLDYMVQKATELGVATLEPVLTRRTIAERVNLDRMRANAIEAAEQCGVLRVPDVRTVMTLEQRLSAWDAGRSLIVCDESAKTRDPISALRQVPRGPLAVLVGPEGGFSPEEFERLAGSPDVHRISLGPRIMRADTAAVAALALVNATLGDWT